MDNKLNNISSTSRNSVDKRKNLALAAAQMSAVFLQNVQQMDLFATMAFIESSSDEEDDHLDNALLREFKALHSKN